MATQSRWPLAWGFIFSALEDGSELKSKVANFGVKFRLVQDLKSSAFDGDTNATDSYYVLLKTSLLYSAIEALDSVIGRSEVSICDRSSVRELRSTPDWQEFLAKLNDIIEKPSLKKEFDLMGLENGHDDMRPLFEALRHGFFHPRLTAENSTLTTKPRLRQFLLKTCDFALQELDNLFYAWSYRLTEGARVSSVVEEEFGIKLSELQLRILLDELEDEDNEDTEEEIIADVLSRLPELEADYLYYEEEVARARNDLGQ